MDKSQEKTLEVKLNSIVGKMLEPTSPTEIMIQIATYHAVRDLVSQLGGSVSINISHTVQ